jgi:hypothetical protein
MNTAAREPYAVRNRAFWTITLLALAHTLPPGLIAEIVVLRPTLSGVCPARYAEHRRGRTPTGRPPDGESNDAVPDTVPDTVSDTVRRDVRTNPGR